ncbi:MAG: hypothetical protein WCG25_01650 [bacterium]
MKNHSLYCELRACVSKSIPSNLDLLLALFCHSKIFFSVSNLRSFCLIFKRLSGTDNICIFFLAVASSNKLIALSGNSLSKIYLSAN